MKGLWLLAFFPGDLEGQLIDRVTVTHDGPVNLPEVQALWDVKAGDPYRQNDVEGGLQRLYQLRLFQDVRLDAERHPNGVRLHLHLIRLPLIGRIRWEGRFLFDSERLLRISQVETGTPSRPETLETARQRLIRFFQESGYPDVQVAFRLETETEGDRQELTWLIQEGTPTTVGRVTFWGPRAFPDWRLIWISRLFPGTRVSDQQMRLARHRLEQFYLRRGYLKVRIDSPDFPRVAGPVNLVWHIESHQPVRVEFVGNQAIADFELRDAIQLFEGGLITAALLEERSRDLERYYHERGFPAAQVRARFSDEAVVFDVREGPLVRRADVVVEGAPPPVLGAVTDAVGPMRGRYRASQWQAVQGQLVEILKADGYLNAQVSGHWQSVTPSRFVIRIQPGDRYWLDRVDLEGWPLSRYPALRAQRGIPYDPRLPNDDALHLTGELRDQGYVSASVHPDVALDALARTVVVRYRVEPGPQQRVDHVLIRGLVFTRPQVVQRYLTVLPGEPVRPTDLFETRRRLFDTGLFRHVTVTADPQADPRWADVMVTLTEGLQTRLSLGIGYASAEGPSATVGYIEENLQGWGRRLHLRASLNWEQQALSATLGDPYLGGSATNGEMGLFAINQTTPAPVWRTGVVGALHHILSPMLLGSLQGFVEFRHASDRQGLLLRGIASGLYDSRDSIIAPTSGRFGAVDVMVTSDVAGQERLLKPTLRAANYWPWDAKTVLVAGVRLGGVAGLGTPVPADQLFTLGGPNGLRGFSLGSGVTGRTQGLATIELRRTLGANWSGAAFGEVGSVDVATPDWRWSLGVGVRYLTPLGVIRLDGAVKLGRRPGESMGALHLTLGDLF